MATERTLRGGELNAAITSAVIGIHTEQLGRGPRSANTFHHGNVVVTLMHDVMSQAEKTLSQRDRADAVSNMRHLLQETMEQEFREAVERLTGHTVVGFVSGNDVAADVAAELFILDAPL